ncbi:hypothetical protein BB559_000422 [Furculomyces boomerangus]|uniref:SANTA domain-containing protein n=1 Tax=Furculomyces boomerangus TaxID=61424 RepID=A0A2T9Z5F7_9FUNG|nr:hypothetical protein BB559_000422 [Furculomyces boomerangus]
MSKKPFNINEISPKSQRILFFERDQLILSETQNQRIFGNQKNTKLLNDNNTSYKQNFNHNPSKNLDLVGNIYHRNKNLFEEHQTYVNASIDERKHEEERLPICLSPGNVMNNINETVIKKNIKFKHQLKNWKVVLKKTSKTSDFYDSNRLCTIEGYSANRLGGLDNCKTTFITERIEENIVRSSSGSMYLLIGELDVGYMRDKGYHNFCRSFLKGFPENWKDILLQEITLFCELTRTIKEPKEQINPVFQTSPDQLNIPSINYGEDRAIIEDNVEYVPSNQNLILYDSKADKNPVEKLVEPGKPSTEIRKIEKKHTNQGLKNANKKRNSHELKNLIADTKNFLSLPLTKNGKRKHELPKENNNINNLRTKESIKNMYSSSDKKKSLLVDKSSKSKVSSFKIEKNVKSKLVQISETKVKGIVKTQVSEKNNSVLKHKDDSKDVATFESSEKTKKKKVSMDNLKDQSRKPEVSDGLCETKNSKKTKLSKNVKKKPDKSGGNKQLPVDLSKEVTTRSGRCVKNPGNWWEGSPKPNGSEKSQRTRIKFIWGKVGIKIEDSEKSLKL